MEGLIKIAPLISCVAIVISAITAFSVFLYTRRVNRRRATLDMVMRTFLDERGTKLYDDFKTLIRRDQSESDPFRLIDLASYSVALEQERNTVIDQLNNYELVALGIHQRLFDEEFYKLWFHRQFTRDYENVSALIKTIQRDRPSTYCEYRTLYERWKRNKHPVNQPSRLKLGWLALTGRFKELDDARVAMKT